MGFHVVIPARYASTRLPGKPLARLAGQTLIEHVYQRGIDSGAESVTVATDDVRIQRACEAFGAEAIMTDTQLASGSDRVAAVARFKGWADDTIVVNLQGDEPLMPGAHIRACAQTLAASGAGMATLAAPITDAGEYRNPNAVKVVCNQNNEALYFSRAPIPAHRDATSDNSTHWGWRHIGLYAYRVATLAQLTHTPPCALEQAEKLEQLRAQWLGLSIVVYHLEQAPPPGIDTPADLQRAQTWMAAH